MNAIELFAGAGGLALGVSLAGFRSVAVVERDRWACESIRENRRRGYPLARDWPLIEGDVRSVDWSAIVGPVDLVAGGPPCQPFSMGGKHRAHLDERDMFPVTVDVIRRFRPRAFLIENVKGLTRSAFANYFQYIQLRLEFPEVAPRADEDWTAHLRRLQKEKTSGALHESGLAYNVTVTLANAADYGAPQRRERVFFVGFRSDLGVEWSFPRPTHHHDALLLDQWVTGDYWERHQVAKRDRPAPPAGPLAKARELGGLPLPFEERPWQTVRDALIDLPDPREPSAVEFHNHHFQDGARAYKGHTGSPIDLPAKTLKAGDHGVPGGENMLALNNGTYRYFTVRESARLQTFPDGYIFQGAWTEAMRQLGNAVPVSLARVVASSIAERLVEADMRQIARRRGRSVA